jgi:hypothetical protein
MLMLSNPGHFDVAGSVNEPDVHDDHSLAQGIVLEDLTGECR